MLDPIRTVDQALEAAAQIAERSVPGLAKRIRALPVAPPPDREALAQRVARVIADEVSDGYDRAFRNKSDWIDNRGLKDGVARDVSGPYQCDFDGAAEEVLRALEIAGALR